VEHRGERGGLARTRRARDQDKPARLVAERPDDGGEAERVEALDLPRDGAEYGSYGAALLEDVASETGQVLQAERKVELEVFLEAMLLRVGEHAIGEGLRVRG